MIEEYYRPREIRYTREQVIWLLRTVLFHDTWPSDHKETGYTGGKNRTVGHHANFETVKMIIGELNARLRLCGIAGLYLEYLTLIDYEDYDYLLSRLAGYTGTTPREVAYLSGMALRYCCYPKRKESSFKRYCIFTRSRDNEKQRKRRGTWIHQNNI